MIKRRIISILLVTVLIFSMALICSAATVTRTGVYDGCTYAITANCETNSFSSYIEYQSSQYGDYDDYMLQTFVEYHYAVQEGWFTQHYYATDYSIASSRISGISKSIDNMEYLYTSYHINAELVTNQYVYPD